MGAFRVARSASDQDYQAGMVSDLTSKRQKVIAVAVDEDQSCEQAWPKTSSDAVTGDPVRKTVTLCSQYRNKCAISAGKS